MWLAQSYIEIVSMLNCMSTDLTAGYPAVWPPHVGHRDRRESRCPTAGDFPPPAADNQRPDDAAAHGICATGTLVYTLVKM